MKKKALRFAIVAATAVGTLTIGQTGVASAAHCQGPTPSPGFSYFGTDHVQESDHAEGGNPAPHMDNPGASNCRETTGSPSDRAPGRG